MCIFRALLLDSRTNVHYNQGRIHLPGEGPLPGTLPFAFSLSAQRKASLPPMPPLIRASEIGSYLYCRRAWWYRRQGLEPENQAGLAAGTSFHRRHGRRVIASVLMRYLALGLALIGLAFIAAWCTSQLG